MAGTLQVGWDGEGSNRLLGIVVEGCPGSAQVRCRKLLSGYETAHAGRWAWGPVRLK